MKAKKHTMKLKCKNCEDVICSAYGGHFVTCSCFENTRENKGIFMDRCRWNSEIYRIGGKPENYEVVNE